MCGIFGIVGRNGSLNYENIARVSAGLMRHRGPDDEGFWSDGKIALSFRRLAIIDLTSGGHQPMTSKCGRFVLVYNGELYNYVALKAELTRAGCTFLTNSDTEVVLQALIKWRHEALRRFNGMFAFGFWDSHTKTLLLGRDHVGMKPLYYAKTQDFLAFGSQLDQVMLPFGNKLTLDKVGLALFLETGHYSAPRTVFHEIKQLEPGSWVELDSSGDLVHGQHFNIREFYHSNCSNVLSSEQLYVELSEAVQRHLVSDVPVATFLSGGLDSAVVTAITSRLYDKPVSAFTLANPGSILDESERAKNFAQFLKIKHCIIEPKNVEDTVFDFQKAYQEPFGDYSALPSLMVCKGASSEFKVILSGDGSDEFFFGYNRMESMLQASPFYRYPLFFRRIMKKIRPSMPGLLFPSFSQMVFRKQSWAPMQAIKVLGVDEEQLATEFLAGLKPDKNLKPDLVIKLNAIQRYFQLQLQKLDRASMYYSLEARVPFADKQFLRYSVAYTAEDCCNDYFRRRKIPIQQIFHKIFTGVPEATGPKKGFTIDLQSSFSRDLRPLLLDYLGTESLFSSWIDFAYWRKQIESNAMPNTFFTWSLLSLQLWADRYMRNS
ncbi:MAG: asparagine synthase (glutamine-hydrolyzing) [Cyclobacteriaceae bacterium]|nr:asparagine synthase (glutamine-hydrolyzing) [Cyclobacteriaceae bacterium]